LTPHIQRAFNLHLGISEMKELSVGMGAALDMLSTGVVLLGIDGRILHMNRIASATIARSNGVVATRTGLKAEHATESAELEKLIREAINASTGKGLKAGGRLLISRTRGAPLHLLITPVRNLPVDLSRSVSAIVFINDPEERIRPNADVLRVTFGLTPAETRVALLLADGNTPQRIADTLGVTINTVRSQMKCIFAKTDTKRQSELVRLLLNNSGLGIHTKPAF
jgi:DNA-binding CsgD family transcriptional regulator